MLELELCILNYPIRRGFLIHYFWNWTVLKQAVFSPLVAPTEPAENAAALGALVEELEQGPAKALQVWWLLLFGV